MFNIVLQLSRVHKCLLIVVYCCELCSIVNLNMCLLVDVLFVNCFADCLDKIKMNI